METNKLLALFYVPPDRENNPFNGLSRFVSASNDMRKLTDSIPSVDTWSIERDPNDKTLRMSASPDDGSKYLIREVPYIC